MEKAKISVVIIAKNEEKKIARCIDSVKWADDIVVVDGFSTDRTCELARSLGANVVQRTFTGSFADDRNAGMENAKNDWVLTLDADEVVTGDFRTALEKMLRQGSGKTDVYKYKRVNFFLGKRMEHGGWTHYVPNLVRKGAVRFDGKVHEVPVYKGEVGTIDAVIEHHPFDSIAQFVERQNRYTDIASKDIMEKDGVLEDSRIKKELTLKPFKIFWKSYVKKQGYKDGLYGLVFAILFAFIHFLKWSKYWDLVKKT